MEIPLKKQQALFRAKTDVKQEICCALEQSVIDQIKLNMLIYSTYLQVSSMVSSTMDNAKSG